MYVEEGGMSAVIPHKTIHLYIVNMICFSQHVKLAGIVDVQ